MADNDNREPLGNSDEMKSYLHCGKCVAEWKEDAPGTAGESPESYARLSVGWTKRGLQIWCVRHQCNVANIDFEGAKHPANCTAHDTH